MATSLLRPRQIETEHAAFKSLCYSRNIWR